jgi:pimeloyl-ACP methyl ester carboxylesterase
MQGSSVLFRRSLGPVAILVMTLASLACGRAVAMEGHYVDLPGGKLWVVDTGGSGAAIVLLHPRTGTSDIWEHQISAFAAAGFRVIAPDKPGAGRSPMPVDTTAAIYADTLDALATSLKIDRFDLVGAAEGGYFAFDFAAWKPARVNRLVLAASGLGVQVDEEGRRFRENAAIPGFSKLPAEVRELSATYRGFDPAGVKRWLEIEHFATPEGAARPVLHTPNTVEKLATLQMPVLVLAGDVDLTTPSGAIRLWAKHLKTKQFKLIPEAGHGLMWEQPEAFNEAVLDFLKR